MQVESGTRQRWQAQAPELLTAIEGEGADCHMRRDAQSGYCVKFDKGLCGIHKQYGADYLSDACYLYPRVTRTLGEHTLMSATLSCPEIARLALYGPENGLALKTGEFARLPQEIKDYLPTELTPDQALAVHRAFVDSAALQNASAESLLSTIITVAFAFTRLPVASWPEAVEFYIAQAQKNQAATQPVPEDPFNVLHALAGLIVATRTPLAERISAILNTMQQALGATLTWETMQIGLAEDSAQRYEAMCAAWKTQYAALYNPLLARWLRFQLAASLFPFSGLGATPAERIIILTVRFVTLRLSLMCECAVHGQASPEIIVRNAQSLARILDHIGDPAFSLNIYTETGWIQERRLQALLSLGQK